MCLGLEKRYTSDLTLGQWALVAPLLPAAKPGGCPRKTCPHCVLNAIFYRLKNGCGWRDLPKDFPPWETVCDYYYAWSRDGTLRAVHDALRAEVRKAEGRHAAPTAAIIDSQSVKTAEKRGAATAGTRPSG